MTASQVATANKMGINTVERSTGTSAKGASSPSEDAAPVVTAQQKAAKTLVDKGIAYAKNGSKLNIQVNSDLQGASSEQIKSWEAAGHTVTIVTTTDIQKDKHIGLGAKDDKKKPSDSLTVEDNADTSLNDSWDKVGKNNDPAAVSEFLNSQ